MVRRVDLPRLTGLRAFAALTVFFCHMNEDLQFKPADIFRDGYAGVGFFFMLSGFVLTWSASTARPVKRSRRIADAVSFYRRRFARIWPTHIAVIALIYVELKPTWATGPLVFSVLLIQAWNLNPNYCDGINDVAWSLSCEAAFYAVWPWLVRPLTTVGKWWSWLLVLVLYGVLLRVTWDYYDLAPNRRFLPYLFPPIRFVEFLAGMLLASAMRGGWQCRVPLPIATLLLVGLVVGLRANTWHVVSFPGLLLDPLMLLILASAATRDVAGRSGWLKSRFLQYLGKISFAFYLVHISCIQYFQVHHPGVQLHGVRGMLVVLALATIVAMVLHHVVEVPVNRLLRPRHDKPVSV